MEEDVVKSPNSGEGDSKFSFFRRNSKSNRELAEARLSMCSSSTSLNLIAGGSGNFKRSMHNIYEKVRDSVHHKPTPDRNTKLSLSSTTDTADLPPKAVKKTSKKDKDISDTVSLYGDAGQDTNSSFKTDGFRQSFMSKFRFSGKDKSATRKPKKESANAGNHSADRLVAATSRLSVSEFDIRDDKQPKLQISTSSPLGSSKSPEVTTPTLSPTSLREISLPKAVDGSKIQQLTTDKLKTLQLMMEEAANEHRHLKNEYKKNPTEVNFSNVEAKEKVIKRLRSQLSQTGEAPPPQLELSVTPGNPPASTRNVGGGGRERQLSCIENSASSLDDREDSSSSSTGLPLHAQQPMPRKFSSRLMKGAYASSNLSRSHSDSYKQKHPPLEFLKPSVSSDDFRTIPENAAIGSLHQNSALSRSHSKSQGGTSDGNSESDQLHPLAEEHSTSSLDVSNSTTSIPGHRTSQQSVTIMTFDDDELPDFERDGSSSSENFFLKFEEIKKKPAHLAIFLHYLISNSDPASLLFYLVSEGYNQGSSKEMRRWAYELYTTFLYEKGPLNLEVEQSCLEPIVEVLSGKSEKEDRLTALFDAPRTAALATIGDQLNDFRTKLSIGLGSFYGEHELKTCTDHSSEMNFIENHLWKQFLLCSREEFERSQATCSALVTVLRTVGFSPANGYLDRFPPFNHKEKSKFSVFSKSSKKNVNMLVADHHLQQQQYSSITSCNHCTNLIGGVGLQGYTCQKCDWNFHKTCLTSVKDKCPSKKVDRSKTTPGLLRKKISIKGSSSMKHTDEPDAKLPRATSLISLWDNKPSSIVHKFFNDKDKDVPKEAPSIPNLKLSRDDSVKSSLDYSFSIASGRFAVADSARGRSPDPDDDAGEGYDPLNKALPNYHLPAYSNNQQEIARDSDFDAEPEVPQLESFIPKECLRKMKPKEKKRQNIINELFHTEKNHVRNLKVMHNVIFIRMNSEFPKDFVDLLFPNLKDIIQVHDDLNKEFKKKKKESENFVVENLSEILVQQFTGEKSDKFKKVCATFCEKQSHALEKLKTRQKKDQKLSAFLQEAAVHPLCRRFELKDLLPTAMQRLTKYPLFITSLLKYTATDSEEYKQLEAALTGSKSVLAHVDMAVQRHENHLKLVDMQKRLDKKGIENANSATLSEYRNLDLSRHTLVFDGPLTWRISRDRLIPLHVVLLEDILLLLQKQDDRLVLKCQSMYIAAGKVDTRMTHSPIIKLVNLLIKPVATDPSAFFLVSQLKDPGPQIYDLIAGSKEEKDKWCKRITEALDAYKVSNPDAWKNSNQLQYNTKQKLHHHHHSQRSAPTSPTTDDSAPMATLTTTRDVSGHITPEKSEQTNKDLRRDQTSPTLENVYERFDDFHRQLSSTTITGVPYVATGVPYAATGDVRDVYKDSDEDDDGDDGFDVVDSSELSQEFLFRKLKKVDRVIQNLTRQQGDLLRKAGGDSSDVPLPLEASNQLDVDISDRNNFVNAKQIVAALLIQINFIVAHIDSMEADKKSALCRSKKTHSNEDNNRSTADELKSCQSLSALPTLKRAEDSDRSGFFQSEEGLASNQSDSNLLNRTNVHSHREDSISNASRDLVNSETNLDSSGLAVKTFREVTDDVGSSFDSPASFQVMKHESEEDFACVRGFADPKKMVSYCLFLQNRLQLLLEAVIKTDEKKKTPEASSSSNVELDSGQDVNYLPPIIEDGPDISDGVSAETKDPADENVAGEDESQVVSSNAPSDREENVAGEERAEDSTETTVSVVNRSSAGDES